MKENTKYYYWPTRYWPTRNHKVYITKNRTTARQNASVKA